MIDEANASLMAGDIARTRHLLVERVKAAPTDRDARAFLFQLFSLMGLWDKAASALTAFVAVAPDAAAFGAVYGGLIAAERAREAAFAGRREPLSAPFEALVSSPPWFDGVLEALACEAAGDDARAVDIRAEAFDLAADTPGRLNDRPFAMLADGDERFGPSLELILDGRYGLAPFETIRSLVFQGPPQTLRDLIWAPVRVTFREGGGARTAFAPVRYPGVTEQSEPRLSLARETRWLTTAAGVSTGQGQRLLFTEAESLPVLDCRTVRFD